MKVRLIKNYQKKQKICVKSWVFGSVGEYLPGMYNVLCLIPYIVKNKSINKVSMLSISYIPDWLIVYCFFISIYTYICYVSI